MGIYAKEESDGWDREALSNVGLMSWIASVERVAYDIRNCSRGSYCEGVGYTDKDLIDALKVINDELCDIVDSMKYETGDCK